MITTRTARLAVTALAAALSAAACGSLSPSSGASQDYTPVATYSPTDAPPAAPGAGQPPLQQVHDPGQVTGTLTGTCHFRGIAPGQLPDPRCTPGAYDPSVTAAVLCSGSYRTRTYRPPAEDTDKFKYDVAYPAYGVPDGTRTELDHLVSLELGGANAASNLWPESPPTPNPKDTVENTLHDWVCATTGSAAQARLRAAQRAIARDWLTAEKVLGIGS